jgi:multiple sugar transport system permease protein
MMLATLMIPSTVLIVPQYLTVASLPLLHVSLIGTPEAIWLPSLSLTPSTSSCSSGSSIRFLRTDGCRGDRWCVPAAGSALDSPADFRPILGVVTISRSSLCGRISCGRYWSRALHANQETINVGITGATTTPENLIIAASAMAAIPTIIFS